MVNYGKYTTPSVEIIILYKECMVIYCHLPPRSFDKFYVFYLTQITTDGATLTLAKQNFHIFFSSEVTYKDVIFCVKINNRPIN